jgi:RNA recognition motif-containing protein
MSTKVFVGNLSFRTTDQNLLDLFGQVGAVKSASIITRGKRSLGYGFVELSTPAEANAAVAKFNNASLLERNIKVEVAKEPQEPREPRVPKEPRAPREPRAPKAVSGQQDQQEGDDAEPKPRRQRRRAPKKSGDAPAAGAVAGSAPAEKKPRQPREPRPERPKIISDTTLFVANLPFSVDDAGLLAIFAGLKPKSAHVVRTRNDRSRGYGFVEFTTKADQQAALATKNGASVDSSTGPRQITVSVSTSVPTPAGAQ